MIPGDSTRLRTEPTRARRVIGVGVQTTGRGCIPVVMLAGDVQGVYHCVDACMSAEDCRALDEWDALELATRPGGVA